jgi:NADPH2:quinone reductase
MRAAWYERTGPAAEVLVVGELPDPTPQAGEVLVRVRASGVNPSDTKQRAGWRGAKPAFARVIPHSDGAGEIVDAGGGVDRARIGTRVWLYNCVGLYDARRGIGAAAELIALPAEQAVPLPEPLDFAAGACLGVPAQTAHRAVFADGAVAGQTVLVAGGAGAVAHYAIQFARLDGARVIATVSSPAKAAHAAAAGAETIDRKTEDVVARVMALTDGAGVDRIVEVDFGANIALDVPILKTNGTIASYSSTAVPEPTFPYYPLAFKGANLHLVQGYNLPPAARAAAIADITRWSGAGKLAHAIAARFPLREIARAHEFLESGRAIGNVVVEID